MAERKQPAGPAMTLGNMRELGVQRLIALLLVSAVQNSVEECPAQQWPQPPTARMEVPPSRECATQTEGLFRCTRRFT